MTEFRALLLVFVIGSIAMAAITAGLLALHANGTVVAMVSFVGIGIGADTCSRIVIHYGDKRRREGSDP